MKLKADIREYLDPKKTVVASVVRQDEIAPSKTTNVQIYKGLEK